MSLFSYANKGNKEVMNELGTSPMGLSNDDVLKRQSEYGRNEIKEKEITIWQLLLNQLTSPFLYLLFGSAILSIILGELIDSVLIVIFIGIDVGFGFYQEYQSEKTISLLKRYQVKRAHVRRSGQEVIIEAHELVPGDIVFLSAGDMIPADIRLLEENNLYVDESILTGESAQVKKIDTVLDVDISEAYQATNMCFIGTMVVKGEARGIVIQTGKQTQLGQITGLVSETHRESSFEKSIKKFSLFLLQLVTITLALIVAANLLVKHNQVDIPTFLIFTVALAVSVIPEALPVVITFALSRGALHLARLNVIVKRLSAIEDLGAIDILCTDKTGTLTENKLTVDRVYPHGATTPLIYSVAGMDLTEVQSKANSFEGAMWNFLSDKERQQVGHYKKQKENPFDPELKRTSILVKESGHLYLMVKGAPEVILTLCHHQSKKDQETLGAWLEEEGKKGRRIIAVGSKSVNSSQDSVVKQDEDLTFIGCVSFVDPIKKSAHEAIEKAQQLGVEIKVLTGDSREVAASVGREAGLIENNEHVITGEEFEKLSIIEQHKAVLIYRIFARVSPAQKYRLVQLLQEVKEVGFLGEGINDAPALKIANVGVVVADASDVAKEAADIILLKKSLHVLVDGIYEGRSIFANTAKYIRATLSSNFGNFYTVAIASLFITYLPLLPVQILLINLLTDFPMIAISTDAVDIAEVKLPRRYDIREIALVGTILGIVSSIFDFMFFVLFYRISPEVLQTNWFIGSVLTEIVFLFSIRTRGVFFKAARPPLIIVFFSLVAFITVLILPFTDLGHKFFKLINPTPEYLGMILAIVVGYFITTEIVKVYLYRFLKTT